MKVKYRIILMDLGASCFGPCDQEHGGRRPESEGERINNFVLQPRDSKIKIRPLCVQPQSCTQVSPERGLLGALTADGLMKAENVF